MARHSHGRKALSDVQGGLFSETFLNRAHGPIFTCGAHSITLRELTHDLDCPFPMSAHRLERILKNDGIHNLKALFNLGINGLAALDGVGDSLCYVATVILDHFNFDIVEFTDEKDSDVRFSTMKRHQKAQQARRKKRNRADRPHLPSDFGIGSTPTSLTA